MDSQKIIAASQLIGIFDKLNHVLLNEKNLDRRELSRQLRRNVDFRDIATQPFLDEIPELDLLISLEISPRDFASNFYHNEIISTAVLSLESISKYLTGIGVVDFPRQITKLPIHTISETIVQSVVDKFWQAISASSRDEIVLRLISVSLDDIMAEHINSNAIRINWLSQMNLSKKTFSTKADLMIMLEPLMAANAAHPEKSIRAIIVRWNEEQRRSLLPNDVNPEALVDFDPYTLNCKDHYQRSKAANRNEFCIDPDF